jgi:hypothetical protein
MRATATASKVEKAVAKYARAASAHGAATESGDYKAANAAARAIASAHRELVDLGAQESLVGLLHEADRGVKLWAASHALSVLPAEAKRVLTELAQEPNSLIATSAEMTLREWKKSNPDVQ